jgi:hypothetical protein
MDGIKAIAGKRRADVDAGNAAAALGDSGRVKLRQHSLRRIDVDQVSSALASI